MTGPHLTLVAVTAAANLFSATADFLRLQRIRDGMTRTGVPAWTLPWLGVPKAAAAAGLLAGLAIPWLAIAAAAGLTAFFLLAIGAHLRAGDHDIGLPLGFLALAIACLITAPA